MLSNDQAFLILTRLKNTNTQITAKASRLCRARKKITRYKTQKIAARISKTSFHPTPTTFSISIVFTARSTVRSGPSPNHSVGVC